MKLEEHLFAQSIAGRMTAAVALVSVCGLLQWGCTTCPAVESNTLEDSKKEKKIRELLVKANWETKDCYKWSEEGKGDEMNCYAGLGKRWSFYDDGTGRFLEGIKDGPMGGGDSTTFEWKLDGNHLHVEETNSLTTYDYRIHSFNDRKILWRESKECVATSMASVDRSK